MKYVRPVEGEDGFGRIHACMRVIIYVCMHE